MARQQVSRAGRLTVIVGLLSATVPEFGPLVVTASRQQQTSKDKIAIVRDVQSAGVLDPTAWLSRPFQTAGPCASRRAGTTALQLLRPDVRTVAIQWYDTQAWSELPRAAAYVRRILDAVPEGGALHGAHLLERGQAGGDCGRTHILRGTAEANSPGKRVPAFRGSIWLPVVGSISWSQSRQLGGA